jgi:hypothetical protein
MWSLVRDIDKRDEIAILTSDHSFEGFSSLPAHARQDVRIDV